MSNKFCRPVAKRHTVTSDAAAHLRRSALCGIDYISASCPALLSMARGDVVYVHKSYSQANANNLSSYDSLGRFIVIKHKVHGVDVYVRYCHCDNIGADVGPVSAGQWLGEYGNTGASQGAHVHVDFWTEHPEAISRHGFRACTMQVAPWPDGIVLTNVNPTEFLLNEFSKEV